MKFGTNLLYDFPSDYDYFFPDKTKAEVWSLIDENIFNKFSENADIVVNRRMRILSFK